VGLHRRRESQYGKRSAGPRSSERGGHRQYRSACWHRRWTHPFGSLLIRGVQRLLCGHRGVRGTAGAASGRLRRLRRRIAPLSSCLPLRRAIFGPTTLLSEPSRCFLLLQIGPTRFCYNLSALFCLAYRVFRPKKEATLLGRTLLVARCRAIFVVALYDGILTRTGARQAERSGQPTSLSPESPHQQSDSQERSCICSRRSWQR